jgi:hypothetical protein
MGCAEDLFERLKQQGEAEIDQLIHNRQSEELFLDFKRSADGGSGRRFHDDDRRNLARAISGFANSEGGIVIWGVDCRDQASGDLPGEKIGIQNPKRFVSWLEGAVSGCTVAPHPHVAHHAIETGNGFAVTHVPKSELAPHQCIQGQQNYYIRSGSNFAPVPHGVLAGLFGRTPQAALFHNWMVEPPQVMPATRTQAAYQVHFVAALTIHNRGPGIARDVYLNYQLFPPGAPSRIVTRQEVTDWTGQTVAGVVMAFMSPNNFRLAPGGLVVPVSMTFDLEPPFQSPLAFKLSYGCESSPRMSFEIKVEPADLAALHLASRETPRGRLTDIFASILPGSAIA